MLNISDFNLTEKFELEDTDFIYDYSWFCSIDIISFEDVEVHIDGNKNKPNYSLLDLSNKILNDFDYHYSRLLNYLHAFFPHHNTNDYMLSEIYIGKFIFNNTIVLEGLTINIIYDEFQYAVNFRYNERSDYDKARSFWPVSFSGCPL